MTLTVSKEYLPGTGRWQAQPNGGAGLGWGKGCEGRDHCCNAKALATANALLKPNRLWHTL